MRRGLARCLRLLARQEDGWTLVEMLVASAVGLALIGSATLVFASAIESQPRTASRTADIDEARTSMERITRELRQGWELPVATPSQLQILTYVKSTTCGGPPASASLACRVTYTCSATACTRVESSPEGTASGSPEQVVSGIAGPDVFSYRSGSGGADPSYVGVQLVFPAEGGEDTITLTDGVALRNPGTAG